MIVAEGLQSKREADGENDLNLGRRNADDSMSLPTMKANVIAR
jgi:hypothetical protein